MVFLRENIFKYLAYRLLQERKRRMDPLDHIHHIRSVLVDDRFAQFRVICEDRVHIETDEIFHRLFFVDSPDKDALACIVDPLHIFICGKSLLDTDDVHSRERLNMADPYSGSVGCKDRRIDFAHIFKRTVILGRHIAVIQIIIRDDDINNSLNDPVIMPVPLDLNIQEELIFAAAGELDDFVQCGNCRPGEFCAEKGTVIEIFDLVISHFPYIFVKAGGSL